VKKQYAGMLLTISCLLTLSVGAQGQDQREVTVTVPFEFVAAGKTLPAGKYAVTRVSEDGFSGLAVSNCDSRATVIVLPKNLRLATRTISR
jgi:hypothetical protein